MSYIKVKREDKTCNVTYNINKSSGLKYENRISAGLSNVLNMSRFYILGSKTHLATGAGHRIRIP